MVFLLLVAGIFVLVSCIFVWINLDEISSLRRQVKILQQKIDLLLEGNNINSTNIRKKSSSFNLNVGDNKVSISNNVVQQSVKENNIAKTKQLQKSNSKSTKKKFSFEEQIGQKLPIWIGGIALSLAGLFLVKYSIENNIITPKARMIIGAIFGGVLIYLSNYFKKATNDINNLKICQSLAGSGIVVLYFITFASTNHYQFINPFFGLIFMVLITAAAILLSIRQGQIIAIFALIGGFITPSAIGFVNDSSLYLFGYIYLFISALMILIKKQRWWFLSIPTIFGSVLWVAFWIVSGISAPDTSVLLLFLLALSGTIVYFSKDDVKGKDFISINLRDPVSIINLLGLTGNIALIGIVMSKSSFGIVDIGLLLIINAAALVLALVNHRSYGFVPLLALVTTISALAAWRLHIDNYEYLAISILILWLIYMVFGYVGLRLKQNKTIWSIINVVSISASYALLYFKLNTYIYVDNFWSVLAFLLAAYMALILSSVINFKSIKLQQLENMFVIFATFICGFVATAFFIKLEREFFYLVICCLIPVISYCKVRLNIQKLQNLIIGLCVIVLILMLKEFGNFINYLARTITSDYNRAGLMHNWNIVKLGIPVLTLFLSSFALQKDKNNFLRQYFDLAFLLVFTLLIYSQFKHLLVQDNYKITFEQRGYITILFFTIATFILYFPEFKKESYILAGKIILYIAILRLIFFEILMYNPMFTHYDIGSVPVFNHLITNYLIPIGFIYYVNSRRLVNDNISNYFPHLLGFCLFVYVNLNIRQLFNGGNLMVSVSDLENYTYSLLWIIMGVAFLIFGVSKNSRSLRYVALALMSLATFKVFLFDTSNLEGLFRVLAFLGLGLSLMGLSYIYTKYVIKK